MPAPTEPIALVVDILWHMALPTLVLVIIQFGGFALVMRAAMMDVLTEDYITLARAKGVDERKRPLQARSEKRDASDGHRHRARLRFHS